MPPKPTRGPFTLLTSASKCGILSNYNNRRPASDKPIPEPRPTPAFRPLLLLLSHRVIAIRIKDSRLCVALSAPSGLLSLASVLPRHLAFATPQNRSPLFTTRYALNFAQPLSIQAIAHSQGGGGTQFPNPLFTALYEGSQVRPKVTRGLLRTLPSRPPLAVVLRPRANSVLAPLGSVPARTAGPVPPKFLTQASPPLTLHIFPNV